MAVALGVAAVVAGVRHALQLTWLPEGVPSFDVADYVNQALRYRDALRQGRFGEVGALALEPDKHPPLHALALGVWLHAVAGGMAAACTFEAGVFVLGLVALVWLGHRVDPRAGSAAGLGAAVLTAWTAEHQRLAAAPMTENLALLASLVATGLALPSVTRRRPGSLGFVVAGAAISAAALVRYNLAPMLFVPLVVAALVEARTFAELRDARVLLLGAPTALALATWLRLRPELGRMLRGFFRNIDSGIPLASVENLTWVPRALADGYVGAPIAVVLGVLFLVGLAHAWGRRLRPESEDAPLRALRTLQLVVLVGAAAITVHPYKLERVLHGTVPLFYLCALLPLARAIQARSGAAAVAGWTGAIAAAGVAVAVLQARNGVETLGRLELADRPEERATLDFVVRQTRGARYVVISGNHPVLTRHSLELWHRLAGRDAVIEQDSKPHPRCGGVAEPGVECSPPLTLRHASDPALRDDTAFLLLEREAGGPPKSRRRDTAERGRNAGWVQVNAAAVEAVAARHALEETASLAIQRGGGRVRVFRAASVVPTEAGEGEP